MPRNCSDVRLLMFIMSVAFFTIFGCIRPPRALPPLPKEASMVDPQTVDLIAILDYGRYAELQGVTVAAQVDASDQACILIATLTDAVDLADGIYLKMRLAGKKINVPVQRYQQSGQIAFVTVTSSPRDGHGDQSDRRPRMATILDLPLGVHDQLVRGIDDQADLVAHGPQSVRINGATVNGMLVISGYALPNELGGSPIMGEVRGKTGLIGIAIAADRSDKNHGTVVAPFTEDHLSIVRDFLISPCPAD